MIRKFQTSVKKKEYKLIDYSEPWMLEPQSINGKQILIFAEVNPQPILPVKEKVIGDV
jgi:hypothetical protein